MTQIVKQFSCTPENMVSWKCPGCGKEFSMPYKCCLEVVQIRCSCKDSMTLDASSLLDWFMMNRDAR